MDNVCHTLVGLAAARTGLNRTTRLATVTLAVASNLPDIDVLSFATGIPPVALRRGWTHGVLAQMTLPIAFAGVMWLIGRFRPDRNPHPALRFSWLLALSYIGVLSHVFLDYLNTYGVRLLMPFSNRWFYGDSVFIVDIWMWVILGVGVLLARKSRNWIATTALIIVSVYIGTMMASAQAARKIVTDRWTDTFGTPPVALMVGPVPITPFRKSIIIDAGDHYVVGRFQWYPRHISFNQTQVPKNDEGPWVGLAMAQEPDFASILVWARFPYWELEQDGNGVRVTLRDVRFPRGFRGFSTTTYIRKEAYARKN
jgi:inner membrane protein